MKKKEDCTCKYCKDTKKVTIAEEQFKVINCPFCNDVDSSWPSDSKELGKLFWPILILTVATMVLAMFLEWKNILP